MVVLHGAETNVAVTLRNRPSFPKDFAPTARTPKGGAACSNCAYYEPPSDEHHGVCLNSYYHDWTGGETLPGPPDQFVSMWWESDQTLPPWQKANGVGKKYVE